MISDGVIADLRLRVAELERVVGHLVTHLGVTIPQAGPEVSRAVSEHIAARQRMPAIKQYCRETGAPLQEAMQVIDQLLERT